MSHEGVTLILRTALILYLIIVGAFFRALVGSSKRRHRIMLLGTLAGLSFGVLVAAPISRWVGADVSGVSACFGMTIGWAVTWLLFARHVPGEAN